MLIIAKSNFFISATLYKYPKVKTTIAKATRTAIATFFNISCYRKSTIRTICRNWLWSKFLRINNWNKSLNVVILDQGDCCQYRNCIRLFRLLICIITELIIYNWMEIYIFIFFNDYGLILWIFFVNSLFGLECRVNLSVSFWLVVILYEIKPQKFYISFY